MSIIPNVCFIVSRLRYSIKSNRRATSLSPSESDRITSKSSALYTEDRAFNYIHIHLSRARALSIGEETAYQYQFSRIEKCRFC